MANECVTTTSVDIEGSEWAMKQCFLNIILGGNGKVIRNPNESMYENGTIVLLTAEPGPGVKFRYWEIDRQRFFQNPLALTMDSDKTVTVRFY